MDDRVRKILYHYGFENQRLKTIEELSELIQALCKGDYNNVREEVADCFIMLEQLKIYLCESTIDKIIDEKLNRTLRRIEDEKSN